jgi:hypothetical protein
LPPLLLQNNGHNNQQQGRTAMKALATTKLVEITLVLAIETYSDDHDGVCAMDYITTAGEAQVIGWDERTLETTYKGEQQ